MGDSVAKCIPDPWYHWHRFALLPKLTIREADDQNRWRFHFHWLVFRAWSMDSVDISAEVNLNDQDLVIRAHVPYLIFGLFIPVFPWWFHQKLWLKSESHKRIIARARTEA